MKKHLSTFVYSILGGICIGIGGTVFLRLNGTFPGGNVVGALLFTIGLFVICTRGYNLYTGKVCYLFDNGPDYLITVAVVWLGNLAGTCGCAAVEQMTGLCGTESGINLAAAQLVGAKMNAGFPSLFLLGILCNILIFIAANGYAKNPHELGKYLSLFLGVSVFILCGTEHSIADMYYWALSGILFEVPGKSFACLLVITLGNAVGGVLFPLLEKLAERFK